MWLYKKNQIYSINGDGEQYRPTLIKKEKRHTNRKLYDACTVTKGCTG